MPSYIFLYSLVEYNRLESEAMKSKDAVRKRIFMLLKKKYDTIPLKARIGNTTRQYAMYYKRKKQKRYVEHVDFNFKRVQYHSFRISLPRIV